MIRSLTRLAMRQRPSSFKVSNICKSSGVVTALLLSLSVVHTAQAKQGVYYSSDSTYRVLSNVNVDALVNIGDSVQVSNDTSNTIRVWDDTPSNNRATAIGCNDVSNGHNGTRSSYINSGNPDFRFELRYRGQGIVCNSQRRAFYFGPGNNAYHNITPMQLFLIRTGNTGSTAAFRLPSFQFCKGEDQHNLSNQGFCWRGEPGGEQLDRYTPIGSLDAPSPPNLGNPTAAAITADCVAPGTTQTIQVVGPASYGPDGAGSIRIVSGPSNGTATVFGTTQIRYTPRGFTNTADTITYEICDSNGDCARSTIRISCENPDQGSPTAPSINANCVAPGTTQTIRVVGPASYGPDGAGSIRIVSGPSNGTATVFGTTQIRYTPSGFTNTADTIIYEICDADGDCARGTIRISCENPDQGSPTAPSINVACIAPGTSQTIQIVPPASFGPDGAGTLRVFSGPSNGTATVVGTTQIRYTPAGFSDTPDSLVYEICDEDGDCARGTIRISCENPDQGNPTAPIIDATCVAPGTAQTIAVVPPASYGPDGAGSLAIIMQPTNGTASVVGTTAILYTPANFSDTTDFIVYRICDADGDCATSFIQVTCPNPVITPVANDDRYEVDGHIQQPLSYNVLENDDLMGNALTSIRITSANPTTAHGGTVTIENNQVVYTSPAGFEGTDTVTYEICTSEGCDTATIEFIVDGQDDAPTPHDDSYTVLNGVATRLDVRSNDSYGINGEGNPAITIVSGPQNGTATINGDGEIVYTANASVGSAIPYQYADDTIVYEICDNDAANVDCAQATVTIEVDSAIKYEIDTSNGSDTVFRLNNLPANAANFEDPFAPDLLVSLNITNNGLPEGTETLVEWCLYDLDNPGTGCVALWQDSAEIISQNPVALPAIGEMVPGTYALFIPEDVRASLLALYQSDASAQDIGSKRFGLYAYDAARYTTIEASDNDEVLGTFLADNDYTPPGGSANDRRDPEGVIDPNRVMDSARVSNNLSTTEGVTLEHNVFAVSQGRVTPVIPNSSTNDEVVMLINQWRVGNGIHGAEHGFYVNSNIRFNPSQENCLRGSRVFFNRLATAATNSAETRIGMLGADDIDCTTLLTAGDYSTSFSMTLTSESNELVCPLSTVGSMSGSVNARIRWTLMDTLQSRLYLQLANVDYDPFNADDPNPINPVFRDLFFTGPLGIPFNLNRFRDQYNRPFAENDDQAGESVYQGPNTILGELTGEVTSKATASVTYEGSDNLLFSKVKPLMIALPTEVYASKFSGGISPRENGDDQAGYAMFEASSDTLAPEVTDQVLEIKDLWAQTATKVLADTLLTGERSLAGQTMGVWAYDYADVTPEPPTTLVADSPNAVNDAVISTVLVGEMGYINFDQVMANDSYGTDGANSVDGRRMNVTDQGSLSIGRAVHRHDIFVVKAISAGDHEMTYRICDADNECDSATAIVRAIAADACEPVASNNFIVRSTSSTGLYATNLQRSILSNDSYGCYGAATDASSFRLLDMSEGLEVRVDGELLRWTAATPGHYNATYEICDSRGSCDQAALLLKIL